MYADFELILEPIQGPNPEPMSPYTLKVTKHSPSGFYSKFVYGEEFKKIHQDSIEVKIVQRNFVITSGRKLISYTTCFLKNPWIL